MWGLEAALPVTLTSRAAMRFKSRRAKLTPEQRKRFADNVRAWRRDFPDRVRLGLNVRV
jgi:hypothetical protein